MSLKKDNAEYESWLGKRCLVVKEDLEYKHEKMKLDAFTFLRATFFRWARRIESICPGLKGAPPVLSVGDTHTENFGTWRDAEGRLVWGINDLDEAAVIPYPFDLVRLAASAGLAPDLEISRRKAAEAILEGYREGLARPRPTLLDEQETWMRPLVACTDKERRKFWKEVEDYPTANPPPPAKVANGFERDLPDHASIVRFATRRKGSGGLGRPRYVAVAAWRGGRVVREAKALVPSAWDWAHGQTASKSHLIDLATGEFRSPDPFLKVENDFIFRRIAADSQKVELGKSAGAELRADLLEAMGFDLGAIHAADKRRAASIRKDLEGRASRWIHEAAAAAAASVEADHRKWKG